MEKYIRNIGHVLMFFSLTAILLYIPGSEITELIQTNAGLLEKMTLSGFYLLLAIGFVWLLTEWFVKDEGWRMPTVLSILLVFLIVVF